MSTRKVTQAKKQRAQRLARSVTPDWNDPLPVAVCTCGHVEDEHAGYRECTIEGCPCIAYERDR